MNIIRDLLLHSGKYTEVDQIQEQNATATILTNRLNQGRGLINYRIIVRYLI
jgi:hypothetical protein